MEVGLLGVDVPDDEEAAGGGAEEDEGAAAEEGVDGRGVDDDDVESPAPVVVVGVGFDPSEMTFGLLLPLAALPLPSEKEAAGLGGSVASFLTNGLGGVAELEPEPSAGFEAPPPRESTLGGRAASCWAVEGPPPPEEEGGGGAYRGWTTGGWNPPPCW